MTGYDQDGKKRSQRGVGSIFTTDQPRHENGVPAIGLLAVGGGVSVWAWTIINLNVSDGGNISQSVASSALTSASLGMLLVLVGMGLSVRSWAARGREGGTKEKGSSLPSKGPDPGLTDEFSEKETLTNEGWDTTWNVKSTHRVSKGLVSAVIQSSVFVASYCGLVAEYNNNPSMQAWVQTNLPLVGDLLNYYGVVLLSGLLGVLAFRSLPRKRSCR